MPPRRLTSSTHTSTPRTPDCEASAKLPVDDTVMPMRILSDVCANPAAGTRAAASASAGSRDHHDFPHMRLLLSWVRERQHGSRPGMASAQKLSNTCATGKIAYNK